MLEMLTAAIANRGGGGPQPGTGYALFAGGHYGGITNRTDKYGYANDVVAQGTNLANARYYLGGTGNETYGLFGGGGGTVVDRYTYSSNVMTGNVATLAFAENGPVGLSSKTEGRFIGGDGQGVYAAVFQYSNSAFSMGTSAKTGRYGGAGAHNNLIGIVTGGISTVNGQPALATDVITFNSDSWVSGTALTQSRAMCAGAGTPTFGIITKDSGANDKYTYSSNVWTSAVALMVPRAYLGGAGDAAVGIFGAGYTGAYVAITDRVTYASDTCRAGTALGQARGYIGASSSTPGGFT